MYQKIKKKYQKFLSVLSLIEGSIKEYNKVVSVANSNSVLCGKLLSELHKNKVVTSIHEVEFKVFSQWGDDGIIQYLISKLDFPNKTFIEFGVESYIEANTRFLLLNDNWSGLVIDGSEENIEYVKNDSISFSHDLYSLARFITAENINELMLGSNFGSELGILSIDIDGNDYWIWKEMAVLKPIVVICEYNSLFGSSNPWTIPYQADWVRPHHADANRLFYGSSLLSLCDLAEEKGYFFIGCNSNGNNAYFVRKDKIGDIKPISVDTGYVKSKFREVMLPTGRLSGDNRFELAIKGQTVYNTRSKSLQKVL